ncbi:MAG: sulfur carrier protein ThiS [Actinomycetes bacterium]
MTFKVLVNGSMIETSPEMTVAGLVALVSDSDRGIAVAIDRVVIPRSQWAATAITEGVAVEIVAAAAGG